MHMLDVNYVAAVTLNSAGVVTWIAKYLVGPIIAIIGLSFIASSNRGRLSKVATQSVIVIWGCIFIAGGALIYGFADAFSHVLFKG